MWPLAHLLLVIRCWAACEVIGHGLTNAQTCHHVEVVMTKMTHAGWHIRHRLICSYRMLHGTGLLMLVMVVDVWLRAEGLRPSHNAGLLWTQQAGGLCLAQIGLDPSDDSFTHLSNKCRHDGLHDASTLGQMDLRLHMGLLEQAHASAKQC